MSEEKVHIKYRNTKRPEENEDKVEPLMSWVGVLMFENGLRSKDDQIDLNQAIEQIRNDKFVLRTGYATTTIYKEKQAN
tara:strand:+ start:1813 stop:2049 length:237 start_codon:yes stop_codon:yes gene_type:complete